MKPKQIAMVAAGLAVVLLCSLVAFHMGRSRPEVQEQPPSRSNAVNAPVVQTVPAAPATPQQSYQAPDASPAQASTYSQIQQAPAQPIRQSQTPTPQNQGPAPVSDDVLPYLKALSRIEAERQTADQQLAARIKAAMPPPQPEQPYDPNREVAAPPPASMPDLQPVVAEYSSLTQRVKALEQSPGVPGSCKDVQGYYLSLVNGMATYSSALQNNKPDPSTLNAMLAAQQEEIRRVSQSQNALSDVCRSHNIQPFFSITGL